MDVAAVQTIDLSALQQDRQAIIARMDSSLSEHGVVFVRMTEAQRAAKDRALDAARAFFDLPFEDKLRVQSPQGAGNACLRGFVPYGSHLQRSADLDVSSANPTPTVPHRAPDRKESFTVGVNTFCDAETRKASAKDAPYFAQESADGRFFAQNQWPDGAVGHELRRAWRSYFDDIMEPLVLQIYDLMAEALQIESAVFANAHRRNFSEMRCNYYLASNPDELPNTGKAGSRNALPFSTPSQRRISPHKDFTDFTILAPDPSARYAHLQIAARGDTPYRLCPYDAECLTVLLGEPMEKWSNGHWFAPLHCVDMPQSAAEMGAKYTMAYFRNPDYETVIAASSKCAERRYPDVSVADHWWGMFERSKRAFGVKFEVGANTSEGVGAKVRADDGKG